MNIEKAMARAIQDHSMIQAGDSILIGASGGKDSLALSWLFARMAANMAARAAAQPAAGLTVPLPAGMTANVRPPLRLGALKVLIGPDVIEGLHEPSTEGSRDGLPGAPEDKLSQLYDAWGIPLRYFGIRAHVESMDTRDHLDPLDRLNARSCSPLI